MCVQEELDEEEILGLELKVHLYDVIGFHSILLMQATLKYHWSHAKVTSF